MRTLKRNSGFSLIEVMVVLLIIGIMASMVAVSYTHLTLPTILLV